MAFSVRLVTPLRFPGGQSREDVAVELALGFVDIFDSVVALPV